MDKLINGLVKTESIHLGFGMYVKDGVVDGTLPLLRSKTLKLKMVSKKIRKRVVTAKRQKRFYDDNQIDIRKLRDLKYKLARAGGFSSVDSAKMRSWNVEKIKEANNELAERRKKDDKILIKE